MNPLTPEMFHYQGFFRLRAPSGRPRWERFGQGGRALCYNPANDSLFIAGHEHHDLVAEVKVPEGTIVWPPEGSSTRAPVLREFFDPAPWRTLEERKLLDTLSGLVVRDGLLYSLWHTYYGVAPAGEINVGTLARMNLNLLAPGFIEGWSHIGPKGTPPFTQKATSGWLFDIPRDWAKANGIPAQTMACGRGPGAGHASSVTAPSMFAFNPASPENATTLLYRDLDHAPPGWTLADKYYGGAWVRVDDYEAVVFVGEVAAGPVWYGSGDGPNGEKDPHRTGKGWHTTRREVRLRAYSIAALTNVIQGEASPETQNAHWHKVLDVFHEAANPRACAWDPEGRRFFIYELWPPTNLPEAYAGEEPRVHVWRVEPSEEPELEEPEPEERIPVRLTVDGQHYSGYLEREDE